MENQPLLPIRLARDDNQDKGAFVIKVMDSLNQLLDSTAIDYEESWQISELFSIYKIPDFMKEINPKAFMPQLVSFGPYHHGRKHLLPMEKEKVRVFHDFITKYGLDVESIVKSVASILEDLWGSYDKLEEEWKQDPDKFLQLMIVDGCFMLQFFMNCPTSIKNMTGNIKRDMRLLENQLPMKLLHKLYFIANQNQPLSQDLKSLVCNSLGISLDGLMAEYSHILDMYKASLLNHPIGRKHRSVKVEKNESDPAECQIIRPATQLREAGIKFEISKTKSLTDVYFDPKYGVLRLPQLVVDGDTESNLLNVMAFETLMPNAGNLVISFITIMGNLVKEDKDVALLSSQKILSVILGNDKAVTEMFSRLTKCMAFHPLSLPAMMTVKSVNEHCSKPWSVWWATLKDPETQKPWVIISVAAASFGFLLQIIQTIYGVYGYHRSTHS